MVSPLQLSGCNISRALSQDISKELEELSRGASPVRDRHPRLLYARLDLIAESVAEGEPILDC